MFDNDGVTLNEKHSFRDFGLLIETVHIAPPNPRRHKITIPGRDGDLDLSGITGDITYDNRLIEIGLNGKKQESEWVPFMSGFMNLYHGKTVKIIFDRDPSYYYTGSAVVAADFEKGIEVARFTLSVDADPYKYEIISSLEDWLWDPFCFETDVVREYGSITVDGSRTIMIPAGRKRVIPVILVSADMTVTYKGVAYELSKGMNKIYDLALPEGENELIFSGNGTVSIDYRGGSL